MYPKNQIFLVFGLSKSGCAATQFLLAQKAVTYIYDENTSPRMQKTMQELQALGARKVVKEQLNATCERCDVLVLSPGIPIDHPVAVAFKRNGKAVVGETELAARYMHCPILAVTGTNGKTTTVSMLTEILQAGGYKAHACGNVGTPMLSYVGLEADNVAVAEISSFQLETLSSLCPHITVVLNVSEDHLNRHYNMENYIFLKSKLLKQVSAAEYAVLNYDDNTVRAFAEKTRASVLFFSMKEKVTGAYVWQGDLYCGEEKIMSVDDLSVRGAHNVQNALAAIAAAKLMGVKASDIARALSSFKGVSHRLQTVCERDGVLYVDDSKGTNVDATQKAVACMRRDTILLLGGKHKGYDYKPLFETLKTSKVMHAVLYGENRYALLKCAREQGYESVSVIPDFFMAVSHAVALAKPGQTVLLSPASASFDAFANYEERGDAFVAIVQPKAAEKAAPQEIREQQESNEQQDVDDKESASVDADEIIAVSDGETQATSAAFEEELE